MQKITPTSRSFPLYFNLTTTGSKIFRWLISILFFKYKCLNHCIKHQNRKFILQYLIEGVYSYILLKPVRQVFSQTSMFEKLTYLLFFTRINFYGLVTSSSFEDSKGVADSPVVFSRQSAPHSLTDLPTILRIVESWNVDKYWVVFKLFVTNQQVKLFFMSNWLISLTEHFWGQRAFCLLSFYFYFLPLSIY